jgi:hypothetical protein
MNATEIVSTPLTYVSRIRDLQQHFRASAAVGLARAVASVAAAFEPVVVSNPTHPKKDAFAKDIASIKRRPACSR